jgi:hypothetical protein
MMGARSYGYYRRAREYRANERGWRAIEARVVEICFGVRRILRAVGPQVSSSDVAPLGCVGPRSSRPPGPVSPKISDRGSPRKFHGDWWAIISPNHESPERHRRPATPNRDTELDCAERAFHDPAFCLLFILSLNHQPCSINHDSSSHFPSSRRLCASVVHASVFCLLSSVLCLLLPRSVNHHA